MVHLTGNLSAVSGILGSVSIACWVVVFSPQILENFRRSSAEGLSVVFIVIWLVGDVFNILGAVLQGVLPTMVIFAIPISISCETFKMLTMLDYIGCVLYTSRCGVTGPVFLL